MLIHVHVKIINSILLVSNIWYCGLNNDMGQEKLNWPKLLWYVRIIVGQVIGVTCVVSECNLCINHMTFPQASNLPLIESTVPPYIRKYWKRNLSVKDRPHEGIKLIKMSTWHWLTLSYLSKHCLLWSITYPSRLSLHKYDNRSWLWNNHWSQMDATSLYTPHMIYSILVILNHQYQ